MTATRCPDCGLVYSACHPCFTEPAVTLEALRSAEPFEVEYVETPGGDVYASALVTPAGDVLCVLDDEGNNVWPDMRAAERSRVAEMVRAMRELRRAEAA